MTQLTPHDIADRKFVCDFALKAALSRAQHVAQSRIDLENLYGGKTASQKDLHAYRTIQSLMVKALALMPSDS